MSQNKQTESVRKRLRKLKPYHLSDGYKKYLYTPDKWSTSFRIQIKKLITDDILTGVTATYTKQVFSVLPRAREALPLTPCRYTLRIARVEPPHTRVRLQVKGDSNPAKTHPFG